MAQSLPNLLCTLFDYHIRLRDQFAHDVEVAARDVAISSGDPVEKIQTGKPLAFEHGGKPVKRFGKPVYLHPWDNDARVRVAYAEAEKIIRGRRRQAGKPFEHSRAWQYAVRWVGTKLPSVSNVTTLLEQYCRLLSRERRVRAQQNKGARHFGDGITNEEWKRRHEKNPQLRQLAHDIDELDARGAGDDLLRKVCERYPDEAKDAGLTKPRVEAAAPSQARGVDSQVPPAWIEKVAHAVHRHTQTEEYTARYREMIGAYLERISPGWKSEALREYVQENPQTIDAELEPKGSAPIPDMLDFIRKHELVRIVMDRRQQGCGITTDAAVPMDQKYATLAATHEKFCRCHGQSVEFWVPPPPGWKSPYQDGATDADWDYLAEASFFLALKADAETLTNDDRAGVERMLADVADDLRRYLDELASRAAKDESRDAEVSPGLMMTGKYGDWRDRIVDCVHEDGRDDRKADRYRTMIREWARGLANKDRPLTIPLREHFRRHLPGWTDQQIEEHIRKSGSGGGDVLQYDPISITTHSGTPLSKKYATLAAIHDESKHCNFPIDPWNGVPFDFDVVHGERPASPPPEFKELVLAVKFGILRDGVATLTEADRTGIEQFLADVSADLEHIEKTSPSHAPGLDTDHEPEELVVDELAQTLTFKGQCIRIGGSEAWRLFTALWKARPAPVDVTELLSRSGKDAVSELKQLLKSKGLAHVASAIKNQKGVGWFVDLR